MGALSGILEHPDEIVALIKLKIATARIERQVPRNDPDLQFCYSMLQRVSRSFSIVIQQLGTELRDAICIFYLVLRALDTVEDDMNIPVDDKLPVLKSFYKSIYDPSFRFPCGDKDYKVLMDNFHHLSAAFLKQAKRYQDAIADITNKMGHGMAKFICEEVETVEDYDEYCHYVAGLVGYGLSKLFHASGLEDLASDDLSNCMGLFLQKTNIIRDYLEDINEIPRPRMFWPREVWGKYSSKLEDLKEEENAEAAVKCLNELVTNALAHAPGCLKYLAALRDPAVFRFCAIPQIMAIGTLALCYDNVNVFRGVVKMRRGLTAKIMDETRSMKDVYGAFSDFSNTIALKINKNDPSAQKTWDCVEAIGQACRSSGFVSGSRVFSSKSRKVSYEALVLLLLILLFVGILYMAGQKAS